MTPYQYLQYSIQKKLHLDFLWYRYCFTVSRDTEALKNRMFPGKLIQEPFGFFFYNDSLEKVKIETVAKTDEPLFRKSDKLIIDRNMIPTLEEEKVETTLGRLIVNLFIHESFGTKIPYINEKFSPSLIEKKIAPGLQTVPAEGAVRDPSVIYVDENIKYCESVAFLESLSSIFSNSISRVGVLPPPGRKEYRAELLKKYEGRLSDPVEMSKFQTEMDDFDDKYLKSDPSYGTFMRGKVAKSRGKIFLTQGGESNNFTGSMEVTPIIPSLEEGISLEDSAFVASANTIRFGSFARGAETVNGGVVAKGLNNAADNWVIVGDDCGTKLGITQLYRGADTNLLVGRSAIIDGKSIKIETAEDASKFDGEPVILRSPMYCLNGSTRTCKTCATPQISVYTRGVTIPLGEVSGGILSDSLKIMHDSSLSAAVMDLRSVLS